MSESRALRALEKENNKLQERIAELEIAKTIGIQACDLLKEQIEALEAENKQLRAIKCPPISEGDVCICLIEKQAERIKALEVLRDTVSVSCNPPKDCNDPEVLKTYMKACFEQANKLY